MRIDTHRHLGGSIPVSFVWDTIRTLGLKHLAESEIEVRQQMTFSATEKRQFNRFLDKFRILDEIPWTEQLIDQSIKAVSDELERDDIDFAWMDFSINKYMKLGWHKHQAVRFVYDAFQRYRPGKVGLILSLKYESMRASQRQHAALIEHEGAAKCLIGLDLVGDEAEFSADFYAPVFKAWNGAKKITRAHVGESQSINNIRDAICKLEVTNIAHGFKVVADAGLMAIALDRHITFDMAITSNYLAGVWERDDWHPAVNLIKTHRVTLGTDDPVICSTSYDNEFAIAKKLGWSDDDCTRARDRALLNSVSLLLP